MQVYNIHICKIKKQYSREFREVCPQTEHKIDHLQVIGRVWPLQIDRKQVSQFVTMVDSCVKQSKPKPFSSHIACPNRGSRN
jgi:hypothetical protein